MLEPSRNQNWGFLKGLNPMNICGGGGGRGGGFALASA